MVIEPPFPKRHAHSVRDARVHELVVLEVCVHACEWAVGGWVRTAAVQNRAEKAGCLGGRDLGGACTTHCMAMRLTGYRVATEGLPERMHAGCLPQGQPGSRPRGHACRIMQ